MCIDCGCETNNQTDSPQHHHHHNHDGTWVSAIGDRNHDYNQDAQYPYLIELKGKENITIEQQNDSPESYWILGDRVSFILTGEQTEGQYSLFDEYVPTQAGTIPHIHSKEQEVFYILEGEVRFQKGNDTLNATAGDLIIVPSGTPHAYQNQGEQSARMLVLTNPSEFAWFESLVRETGQPGTDPSISPPLDEETRKRILDAFTRNQAVALNSMIFAAPKFSVSEDGTPIAAITVVRPLNNQGTASATVTLSNGTANSTEDYSNIQIPVNFADGESVQIVNVPITDDSIIESNETINLKLSNPTGDSIVGLLQDTAVLTIIDNDALPQAANGLKINGNDNREILTGGENSENITGIKGDDTLIGGGSQDLFTINLSDGIDTINDFTGVGKGTNPGNDIVAEIDTLKFEGEGLTAKNMLLTQQGNDLLISFAGVDDTGAILKDFQLENLDNLRQTTGASVNIGNILFDGETAFQDSFDVFNADIQNQKVFNHNSVTFLNDLDNKTKGFEKSDDVINGQGGNDYLSGLSGNDLLRGGTGDDILEGGFGRDALIGGIGRDLFSFAPFSGIDTVVDFTEGEDFIGLLEGLTFTDLRITQGTGLSAENTLISIESSNELLAILNGVEADTITDDDFVIVQYNTA